MSVRAGSSRALRGEGQELVISSADDPVACLGQLDPGAGQIADWLRDHKPGVVGQLLQGMSFGILLLDRADVREEQVRAYVAGQLAQVLVVPRRLDATVARGLPGRKTSATPGGQQGRG